jgi:hypothetical protein
MALKLGHVFLATAPLSYTRPPNKPAIIECIGGRANKDSYSLE